MGKSSRANNKEHNGKIVIVVCTKRKTMMQEILGEERRGG